MKTIPFMVTSSGSTPEEAFIDAAHKALLNAPKGSLHSGTIGEKIDFEVFYDKAPSVIRRLSASTTAPLNHKTSVIQGLEKNPNDVALIAKGLLLLRDDRLGDCYGPAGCLRQDSGRWLFFGWARKDENLTEKS